MGLRLYNVQTRQPEDVDNMEEAILQGTHSFPVGQRVNIRKGDETISIDTREINKAIQNGYTIERPNQRAVREYVEDNDGLGGAIKVGLSQFADEALLGLPEMIYDKTADPLEVAKKEALKKEHELANTLGGIGGFGASLYAPGVSALFKGATKGGNIVSKHLAEKIIASSSGQVGKRAAGKVAKDLAAKTAVGASKLGTEGLIFSAPHAITEAALGDPEAAAETLLSGVGFGAAFGGAGALTKELFKVSRVSEKVKGLKEKIKHDLKHDRVLNKKAKQSAIEALNPNLSQMERLDVVTKPERLESIGGDLIEEGIFDGMTSHQKMWQRLNERTSDYGRQIGEKLQSLDDRFGEAVQINPWDLAKSVKRSVAQRFKGKGALQGELKKLNRDLDDLIHASTKKVRVPAADVSDVQAELRRQGLPGVSLEDAAGMVPMKSENQVRMWSLSEANSQKSLYQDKIKNWGLEDKLHKRLVREIDSAINESIESTIKKVGGPKELEAFQVLKKKYGNLISAEEIAKKSAAREMRNNDFGLTSFQTGGAGAVVGAMIGGPTGALIGGAIGGLGREFTRRYGEQVMSKVYNNLDGLLFAERAMKRTAHQLDEVPTILSRMSSRASKVPESAAMGASVRALLGVSGDSNEEVMEKAQEKFEKYMDPNQRIEWVSATTTPIGELGAPNISAAFNKKLMETYDFLFSSFPKDNRKKSPYQKKQKYYVTNREMREFENKVSVVADPMSVLKDLEAGRLNATKVDALKVVYPRLYEMIKDKITQSVVEAEGLDLSYDQQINLSLLMGEDLDESLTGASMMRAQSAFQAPGDSEEQTQNGADLDIAKQYQGSSIFKG